MYIWCFWVTLWKNHPSSRFYTKLVVCIKLNLSKNLVLHIAFRVKPLIKRFVSFLLKYVHFMSYLKCRCIEEKNLYCLLLQRNIFQKFGSILCKKIDWIHKISSIQLKSILIRILRWKRNFVPVWKENECFSYKRTYIN